MNKPNTTKLRLEAQAMSSGWSHVFPSGHSQGVQSKYNIAFYSGNKIY